MKPFDLEAAKRGEPCMRREGQKVIFVAHVPEARETQRVVFLDEEGMIVIRPESGLYFPSVDGHPGDVVMVPKKKTLWINIYDRYYQCQWFPTREMADDWASLKGLVRVGNQAWPLEIEE